LPAFVVLVHRFLEKIRSGKIGLEAANFETGQEIRLAFQRGENAPGIALRAEQATGRELRNYEAERLRFLSAPLSPGFFEVTQGGDALLRGAVHFGDTREADLSEAATEDTLGDPAAEVVRLHSKEDSLWRVWILLAVGCALASWYYARGRSRVATEENGDAVAATGTQGHGVAA
jgi:hypothetical protein